MRIDGVGQCALPDFEYLIRLSEMLESEIQVACARDILGEFRLSGGM